MGSIFDRNSTQERPSLGQSMLSELGGALHPRISIRGGSFALLDASGQRYGAPCILQQTPQGQKMVMLSIIVGSNPHKSRVYFDQPYDPDNPGPPDCFSDNGTAPSVNASNPQARTCAECEWGKWGSDTSQLTGKKTKACSEKKKIGILVVGDSTTHVYELQIPPATLKNLAKYVSQVVAISPPGTNRKAEPSDLITAISFVPGQTGILEFAAYAWLSSASFGPNGAIQVCLDAQGQPVVAADQGTEVADVIDEIWRGNELDEILGLKDQPWSPPALTGPLPGMHGRLPEALLAGGMVTTTPEPYRPPASAQQEQAKVLSFANPAPSPNSAQGSPAPSPAPAAPPTPSRGRGRPRATPAATPSLAGPAATPPAGKQEDIPPFLRRQPAQGPEGPAPAPAPTTGTFAAAPAPANALADAVNKAMNMALPRG
ncbi:MAG TPA: hypothetical protein VF748_14940 [Candidatus Acidoferrum sp.]